MNNLSSFGVQELNAGEIKETQGGLIPIVIFGVKILGAKAVTAIFAAGVTVGTAGAVAALAK